MALIDKLTFIADKIRNLMGLSEEMDLVAMSENLEEAVNECDAQAGLIEQIKTALEGKAAGGSSIITEDWQRPSNWPDLSSLGKPAPGTTYLTFDCRYAKRGINPYFKIAAFNINGVNTRTFKRGYVENGEFVVTEDIGWTTHVEITLPADEGDFVVYELTGLRGVGLQSGNMNQICAVPLVEVYGTAYPGTDPFYGANSYSATISAMTKSLVSYDNEFYGRIFDVSYHPGYSQLEYLNSDEWALNSSVTGLNRSFRSFQFLKTLKLPFNTSAINNMSQMFSNDYALEELDISTFDTTNVTNMQEMFAYCYNLRALDLSHFATNAVTNFSNMFRGCHSLYDLDFSGLDTTSVSSTSTLTMFDTCPNLVHLKVGKITVNFKINGCNNLSHDSLMNVINALEPTETTLTLTIGSTNIAKLTEEELAIATEKGWTIV